MKRLLLLVATVFCIGTVANAQIIRVEELENYAKEKYGEYWVEAATNLGSTLNLDKNNALTFVQVVEAPGKTKEQLYVLLNYWFSASFNDANSVIQMNDKELGTIIAQGYVEGVAEHTGGTSHYSVSIKPVIKCDLKEGKVRITYTLPFYVVHQVVGGGWLGAMGTNTVPTHANLNWTLDSCFPFAQKDKHKKTSCKALIMANAYSQVIMDKIEECIKNGVTGNEGDDW